MRRSCLISQIGKENVELVTLDNLGRRILRVIVCLVIFVPLITLLDTIEESWLPHDKELFFTLHEHILIGTFCILCIDKISKLLLVSIHPLLLGILEHLHRGVIEAIVVDDIEADSCVQSRFLNLLCQAKLNVRPPQLV